MLILTTSKAAEHLRLVGKDVSDNYVMSDAKNLSAGSFGSFEHKVELKLFEVDTADTDLETLINLSIAFNFKFEIYRNNRFYRPFYSP
ncbi:MAG: hypothetical protein JSS79_05205 [Bacteroidetes bacterium]|nr:hypothetical protein [Bacteroidota bacterium]